MKPTIGPAPLIIAQAIELGILCRPLDGKWFGAALAPSKDSFERIEAASNNYLGLYYPTPHQIMLDWELTTRGLIDAEFNSNISHPF